MTSWFSRTPAKAQASGRASAGAPLELVRYNQDTGKFEVGEDALAVLRKVRTPIGVVSVCGRARQGKSFILNQLLGATTGFKVAPSVRPCTKGLWMWSAPVKRTSADGSAYHLVMLDTEGIDAYDQTGQYSTQIFSLAVLLSSLFVYNQMGGIDEAALDRLSLVTEMTKHIRVRANEGQASEAELSSFTPAFLWLLRDFYLQLEDGGRSVTAREYLESALAPVQGRGSAADAKNQIRESIKSLFPDRDCFTLVRPVNEEAQLANLESVPGGALRPEFKEGLSRLTALIFRKAQPKMLGTMVISGPILAALTEAYVAAINDGAVPTIATAWQGVAEAECRRAADVGEAAYAAAFHADVAAEEAALDAEHTHALQAALDAFNEAAVGHEEPRRVNEARLRDKLAASYGATKQAKLATAALACEQLLKEGGAQLAAAARTPGATVEGLQRELAAFRARYEAAAAGPSKWRSYSEFVAGPFAGLLADVGERARSAAAAQVAEERAKAAQAAAAAKEGELRRQQLQAAADSAQAKAQAAARDAAAAQAQMSSQAATMAALQAREAALTQQLEDMARKKEAEVAAARAAASSQAVVAGSAARARVLELEAQLAVLAADKEALQRQLSAATEAQRRLEGQVAQLAADKEVAVAQREAEAAKMQAELAQWKAEQHRAMASYAPPDAVATGTAGGGEHDETFMDADGGADPSAMTIPQIKEWLVEHGHEGAVWEMASNRKAKKADWVKLLNERSGAT